MKASSNTGSTTSTGLVAALAKRNTQTPIQHVSLEDLYANPNNSVDRLANTDTLAELAASFQSIGVLSPLVVVPISDGLMVVAGHRRLAAARIAGLNTVPVVIREDLADREAEVMLAENRLRQDLTPIEEAHAFKRLHDRGWSQTRIAKEVGVDQSLVSRYLSLLRLPEEFQNLLHTGKMTFKEGTEIASKHAPDVLQEAAQHLGEDRPPLLALCDAHEALAIRAGDERAKKVATDIGATWDSFENMRDRRDWNQVFDEGGIAHWKKRAAEEDIIVTRQGYANGEGVSYWLYQPPVADRMKEKKAAGRAAKQVAAQDQRHRWTALCSLAKTRPSRTTWHDFAAATILLRGDHEMEVQPLLGKLHTDAGTPEVRYEWTSERHQYTLPENASLDTTAWLIMLARCELYYRSYPKATNNRAMTIYLIQLAIHGYTPHDTGL